MGHDFFKLGGKLRIGRELELAHQMRPKAMSTPYALHRADADPRGLRHRCAGPVAGFQRRPSLRQGNRTLGHIRARWWNDTTWRNIGFLLLAALRDDRRLRDAAGDEQAGTRR
jgi:hypothetical protein